MTTFAPSVPDAAIREAVLIAARSWGTEAVTARPTPFDDGDTTAAVWCFEVIGRHPHGWDLFGREMLIEVPVC